MGGGGGGVFYCKHPWQNPDRDLQITSYNTQISTPKGTTFFLIDSYMYLRSMNPVVMVPSYGASRALIQTQ